MTRIGQNVRKRRTREHIIVDQSLNHVEKFLIDAGYTATRVERDYGYDLVVTTYDGRGFVQPGLIYLQLKASSRLRLSRSKSAFAFRIDRRDHNLWRAEPMPVLLVLYDATKRRAYWLHIQEYFVKSPKFSTSLETKTATVYVPKRNAFTERTARILCRKKAKILRQLGGNVRHGT